MADRAYLERLCRELTDKGMIIETGWVALRLACVPNDASQIQLDEMRAAFFAGAMHLFSTLMTILEPDAKPTKKDLDRMGQIDAELRKFSSELALRIVPAKGNS